MKNLFDLLFFLNTVIIGVYGGIYSFEKFIKSQRKNIQRI